MGTRPPWHQRRPVTVDQWIVEALLSIAGQLDDIDTKIDLLTEGINMAEDQLQAAFDQLSAQVSAAIDAETQGASELAALAAQIQGFQPGTTLTADDINNLATGLTAATQTLSDAAAAAQTPATTPPATDPGAATDQPAG